eukprot:582157_1
MGNKTSQNEPHMPFKERITTLWSGGTIDEATMIGHIGKVYSVDIRQASNDNPNRVYVVSVSQDESALLWELSIHRSRKTKLKWKKIRKILLNQSWRMSIALSYDNKYIATGGVNNSVDIFSFPAKNEISPNKYREDFDADGYVSSVRFVPNNPSLLCYGSGDNCVYIWDFERRIRLAKLTEFASQSVLVWNVTDIVMKKEKHRNYSLILDWTFTTDVCVDEFDIWLRTCSFSPNGKYLAVGGTDALFNIFCTLEGQLIHGEPTVIMHTDTTEDANSITSVCWLDDHTAIGVRECGGSMPIIAINELQHDEFMINCLVYCMSRLLPEEHVHGGNINIAKIILHFVDIEIVEHEICTKADDKARKSCVASCGGGLFLVGDWNMKIHAYLA